MFQVYGRTPDVVSNTDNWNRVGPADIKKKVWVFNVLWAVACPQALGRPKPEGRS